MEVIVPTGHVQVQVGQGFEQPAPTAGVGIRWVFKVLSRPVCDSVILRWVITQTI